MPYGIRVFDSALLDLANLLESVPPQRRDAIGAAIEDVLAAFALLPTAQRPPGLIAPLRFNADGVQYRWLFSWRYEATEQTLDITGFGRDPSTAL